jgi:hypothetical protein
MLGDTPAPADDGFKTVDLKGNIDVVFLPDFDEQYAVNNCNVLAKSSYGLRFRDGWQLVGVDGKFDSTTVAIALLQTIDSAIQTAQSLATTALDTRAKLEAAQKKVNNIVNRDARGRPMPYVVLEVKRERVIPPGLYRINKPWEVEEGAAPCGPGLLGKMGLPTVEMVSVTKAEVHDQP